jgi:tRNA pseudouridine38-40 synthase
VGLRDFQSFAASDRTVIQEGEDGSGEPSTLVLVDRLDIGEAGDLVLIGIEGSHFLWRMVRRVVGVLVEIGRGGLDPEAAASFLSTSSDAPARLTAPASGLFLERVYYTADARGSQLRPITPLVESRS